MAAFELFRASLFFALQRTAYQNQGALNNQLQALQLDVRTLRLEAI